MAVPKKRMSKSRTRMRRSQQNRIEKPGHGWCPGCGEPKLPHRVCMHCGQYKDRQVVPVVEI